MPDADPVTELREAARLMRERAAAASPGPWHQLCMGSEGCSVLNDGHLRDRRLVSFSGRKEWKADHADAVHIASWSPGVALAVADWLDAEAWTVEASEYRVADPLAVAVAVAYLGRTDDQSVT